MHTADLLQEAGLAVVEAGSGAQALAAIESRAPDVLVVDVGLPDMSGVELARRIRGRLPDLPVVFATGHAQVDGIEAMPRVEVVGKPYGADDLCASIARLTSGTPADRSG